MKSRVSAVRPAATIAIFLFLSVSFVSALNYFKFEKVLRATQNATIEIIGKSLIETVESALDLGMRVEDLGSLQPQLRELALAERSIKRIVVRDYLGRPVADTQGSDREGGQRAGDAAPQDNTSPPAVSLSAFNNFGAVAAKVDLYRGEGTVEASLANLVRAFLLACFESFLLALPVVMAGVTWLARMGRAGDDELELKRFESRSLILSGLAVTSVVVYVSVAIFSVFEREVRPVMQGEAAAIARSVASPLARASETGFAYSAFPDLDHYLGEQLKLFPKAIAVGLRQNDGWFTQRNRDGFTSVVLSTPQAAEQPATMLTEFGYEAIIPLKTGDAVAATLHVVTSPEAANVAISDARWDILVLILVSLLTIFEALRFIYGRAAASPGASHVASPHPAIARFPLFLFVFGEQLPVSFLVIHGRDLAGPEASSITYGLPIIAFIVAVAVVGPYAAALIERFGVRAALAGASLATGLGFFMAFAAAEMSWFVASRCLSGAGYAIATSALQTVMSRGDNEQQVKTNLASFTSAVMIACVCGAAVGGVLVERFGSHVVFLASSALVLAPIVFCGWLANEPPRVSGGSQPAARLRGSRLVAFLAVLCLVAIPAKFVLNGFVYYLAPLQLKDMGLSQAAVGRNVMLYALCMVPAISLGKWLMARDWPGEALVLAASLFTCIALLAAPLDTALAIAMIGVAQGVNSVPMLSRIPHISAGDRGVQMSLFAMLRSGERVGGIFGAIAAGAALAFLPGHEATLVLLGGAVLVFVILFTRYVLVARSSVQ